MAKQPAKGRKTPVKSQKTVELPKKTPESQASTKPVVDPIPAEVHEEPAVESVQSAQDVEKPTKLAEISPAVSAAPAPQKSTFFPLLFGGLIAGAIGFGIATVFDPQVDNTLIDQLAQQAGAIAALKQQVANAPVVDLSEVETAQSTLITNMDVLGSKLSDLDDRLIALENLPRGEGTASVPALAAYEAELDALRGQISEMTGIAETQLDAARAEADAIEENAASAARTAAARAALSRLQTGLESGAPLGAALADLEGAISGPAPATLIAVQDGVPTLANLQDQFPEIARAALATARREGVSGEDTGGLSSFLRNQFDVRSVTPQEGTSADAILSRAEAAVRQGRLADALAEISALPEVARAEMSDWLGQAEARADAIAAVDILSTTLRGN